MTILLVASLALLFILWLLGQPYLTERRRQRIRAQPFPAAWRDILKRRVPYARALPADLQLQLKRHIQVFVAEKAFIGCDGLEVTDEMRVTVAAQACLLILNRTGYYYPELRQILVYPGSFVVQQAHTDDSGVAHQGRAVLSGESWSQGQVVLSWQDTLDGAADPTDGQNVAIHEFAHQLDQETGAANGAPLLERRAYYERWSKVLGAEFDALRMRPAPNETSLFSDYGATDPAEFFAVISEVFFEQPQRMAEQHPALYRELVQFYRLDPLTW
ncbi:MAG: zinc-dependent peptidase [Gammaproteobacteria bacterium]|uniref:M90 family metallopeptidase n=1 Tax=Rhodoferax sp. TaxID=50421 RepID=UPI0017A0762F|nr:M90 family metallopeptidase [Rhodoferax sp.]MBU3897741.1 zinc-dependent peptidase [Gammaproteobacteria bacterium]MBA3059424.1 zinc-dependent peptidase [Rhodoferax sp.]MBU3997099.1 zinc-dependent peptidase [Gammaproteobacteria bacterium]MBU4081584.1 zinc-dependent peptidase [Gammaproteobacteria bacterium]MBU4115381.1 zinc-dependent peptidase [Gammaproteobacteria bacterium]